MSENLETSQPRKAEESSDQQEQSKKFLFRLQRIVPRDLATAAPSRVTCVSSPVSHNGTLNAPQEIEFQMTFGKLAAKVWGPPDGLPVFALHGWLDNAGTFDTLIPLLPSNLRIVAVDTVGHGLSDSFPPDIAYNFVDSLLAIERFAKQLKWERFSFIGHSLGGAMAMLYAGTFPEKVDKLVCLDVIRSIPTITEKIHVRLRKAVGKLLRYEDAIIDGPERPISYEMAVERCISGTFGSLDENACDVLFKRGLQKIDGGYIFRRDRRMLAAPLSFIAKEDQLHLARQVTAHVLIVKCSEGPYFEDPDAYLEHVEALKTNAKSVRYVEVEGKHHTHLTHPERVAPLITELFQLV